MSALSNDELLRRVDAGETFASIGEAFGLTRQAVYQRHKRLRGQTTREILLDMRAEDPKLAKQPVPRKKPARIPKSESAQGTCIRQTFNAIEQLHCINEHTLRLVDEAEADGDFSLKCIAELRGQIKLAMEIQERVYSQQEARKFMELLVQILKEVDPDALIRFKKRLDDERFFIDVLGLD